MAQILPVARAAVNAKADITARKANAWKSVSLNVTAKTVVITVVMGTAEHVLATRYATQMVSVYATNSVPSSNVDPTLPAAKAAASARAAIPATVAPVRKTVFRSVTARAAVPPPTAAAAHAAAD